MVKWWRILVLGLRNYRIYCRLWVDLKILFLFWLLLDKFFIVFLDIYDFYWLIKKKFKGIERSIVIKLKRKKCIEEGMKG